MVVYYALGGGLGHITRAVKALDALGLRDRGVILSASEYLRDGRVTDGVPVIPVPARLGRDRDAFRAWLADVLGALRPDRLLVDSFPGGILGELCGMALPPAEHVARRLRWPVYARRLDGPLPRFEATHVLEPLDERHAQRLSACSWRIAPLSLPQPPGVAGGALLEGEHWIVVHSGPDEEVVGLARSAARSRRVGGSSATIAVVSPRAPSSLPLQATWIDVYPVAPFFGYAEKVVSAAGFNVMHETASVRDRHVFVPYFRALDDQSARAAAFSCLVMPHRGNTPPS